MSTDPAPMTEERLQQLLAAIPAGAKRDHAAGQFVAKLSFDQRCEVLAFSASGYRTPVIAAAFALHRRTVAHIASPTSPHYRSVREKLDELGLNAFRIRYITEEGAGKVAAAQADFERGIGEASQREPAYRADKADAKHPNQRKAEKAGWHRTERGGKFEVVWVDEGTPHADGEPCKAGWYCRREQDAENDYLVDGGSDCYNSSTQAYQYGVAHL